MDIREAFGFAIPEGCGAEYKSGKNYTFAPLFTDFMNFITLLLLAAGLSMDAFAVSVCKGISMKKTGLPQALVVGVWFGGFQALMPITGYYLGIQFMRLISVWDHWIAFGLLAIIGINMIREAVGENGRKDDGASPVDRDGKAAKPEKADLAFRPMLMAAVATSIDALAVGVSFAAMEGVNIWTSAGTIGIVTLFFSAAGVKAGHLVGKGLASKAEIVGGVILICIGIKIIVEHMIL